MCTINRICRIDTIHSIDAGGVGRTDDTQKIIDRDGIRRVDRIRKIDKVHTTDSVRKIDRLHEIDGIRRIRMVCAIHMDYTRQVGKKV